MANAETLKDTGCVTVNVGELLTEIGTDFETTEGEIRVPAERIPALIVALYDKVEETLQECFNKQLVIEFGDGVVADSLEQLISLVISVLRAQTSRD